ncbi:MAG: hypothetical protein ACPH5O_05160 [Litorivicinaceae bacterium]|jgi:hypothetical protein|tara:strand:- start:120 stop:548 length:429 start_codon:yes stop_codon:yes gene_type:complete
MCGDLDDYDPGKHVELLLDGIKKHIGTPRVASSGSWAQDIADLDLTASNKELLAHFMAMGSAVSKRRDENEQLESIAQMAQIHAYLSGVLTGVLLDDGTLQQIGIQKFLEGVSVGRSIDQEVAADIAHGHSHDHHHEHHHHH